MRRVISDNKYQVHGYAVMLAVMLALVSCSESTKSYDTAPKDSVVFLHVSQDAVPDSKTIITGESLDRVIWSEKDRIAFYYRPSGSVENPQVSELHAYRLYADETIFTGNLTGTIDGSYDCFGVHPLPHSVDGTKAVFNLPAEQSGSYDSSLSEVFDIMVADPVSGQVLNGDGQSVFMNFSHKCHAMRIQVPEGRNKWGVDVRKLRIEFPAAVVGTLSVDMASPSAAPVLSDGSNTVYVNLSEGLNESQEDASDGNYVWIFLAPVHISGTVKFTAYDGHGYQSETISVALEKELEPGRITPVNLTIPQELPVTWMKFSIDGNNLGEDVNSFSIIAPDGAVFRGSRTKETFAVNPENSYSVGFYASYDGIDNASLFKDGICGAEFESENAIVTSEFPVKAFDNGSITEYSLTVPYLLEQDFSAAAGHDGSNETTMLDGFNLEGWSASNFEISGGNNIQMNVYQGTSTSSINNREGRFDTPLLTNLKEEAEVPVEISFDVAGTKAEGTLSNPKIMYSRYAFGIDTRSDAIGYDKDIENLIIGYEDAWKDGNFNSKTVQANVTRKCRLSWRAAFENRGGSWASAITAKTVYVYVDNIKVSIKRD